MLWRVSVVCIAGLTLITSSSLTAGQAQDLSDILSRAGAYVEEFQRRLSSIVAEETYSQEVVTPVGVDGSAGGAIQRRLLRSDLLLVRPENAIKWVQFRDVFEVDGRPVRDREERLVKLFLSDVGSSAEQIEEILAESARYNIGRIHRTMNLPVLPLSVLLPSSQPRFRFTVDEAPGNNRRPRIGNRTVEATPTFKVTAEGWIVKFEEMTGPTLVHTTARANIFSRGRFWLEADTGRVLMSEMITEDARVRGELVVSYQSEPLLGLLVPIELKEHYTEGGARPRIDGHATYSNFRQFQVSTEQAIDPIR